MLSFAFVYAASMIGLFFVVLTSVIVYLAAKKIEKVDDDRKKKILLLSMGGCLFILIFLKYLSGLPIFTDRNLLIFGNEMSLQSVIKKYLIPIGMSYYTLQVISYLLDVYWGRMEAEQDYWKVLLFTCYFPQLVQGPISKYSELAPELFKEHKLDWKNIKYGVQLMFWGFFKKMLIADRIGIYVNAIFHDSVTPYGLTAWIGLVFYGIQLYCDFSGGIDVIRGASECFGIGLKENFRQPYFSLSLGEFWRRWHISLGSWFREYVYIPLGGNRVTVPRHLLNLLIVWFLTGLWHGASWNFVAWGLFYGVILITEKYFTGKILAKLPEAVQTLYTMILVMLGWVLFFSPTLGSALTWIGNMFGQGATGFMDSQALYLIMRNWLFWVAGIIGSTPFMHLLGKRLVFNEERPHTVLAGCLMTGLFVLCVAYLVTESYNPFLYFRF